MDKEKRIEEMAKVLSRKCAYPCPILLDKPCELCQAETLFIENYRKINENDIVIPEKLTEEISAEDILKIAIYNDKIRKETAREILNILKELYTTPYSRFYECIEDIAEKYGVDLGEDNEE